MGFSMLRFAGLFRLGIFQSNLDLPMFGIKTNLGHATSPIWEESGMQHAILVSSSNIDLLMENNHYLKCAKIKWKTSNMPGHEFGGK